ncbi:ATP-binding protein [Mucilaginibacter sp. CSA2-8R]|uniref:ATP-binding protein n=1 Tax=Mucilaginibacter sp. CSA2-8R TaxID=3141542 RepID=UPI00315D1B5D
MSIETSGTKIDEIPVEISYRIIELFSAGLYSSPNKAFEELVSNSYDAGASKVSVQVPIDKTLPESVLWVCDNGESMGKDGLKQFWKIGSSTKRAIEKTDRLVIGKFGIGKLATYILTNKLTLICKAKDGNYYAVTMNYTNINDSSERTGIKLDERQLTLDQVKVALNPYVGGANEKLLSFKLWGTDAEPTWTMAIMSELKPKAHQIQEGRLKWILSTALPLNPAFKLSYNGVEITPSKEKIAIKKTFIFGVDDEVAKRNKYTVGTYRGQPSVNMNTIHNVTGQIDLYQESLLASKSDNISRSHGVFLMVRGRLINIDDALLPGMSPLFHGLFNRIRITVHADELDSYITSTREAVKESEQLSEIKAYINSKFNEVRAFYTSVIEEEERKNRASYKIAAASSGLSRRPILVAAKRFFDGEISDLLLTEFPKGLSSEETMSFISRLEDDLVSEKGMIHSVEWVALNPDDPIAKLELETGIAKINLLHPFFANFMDEVKSTLPFQLIALTEILTECFLIENGIKQDEVYSIMRRRDDILRELTFSDKPNAPFVAALLQNSLGDSTGLEDSVKQAFVSLGFETSKIGGPGKPDGKANAYLGPVGSAENYSVTYDAKSTAKDKIKATTAHISGVDRHRDDYNADYAAVVAIDFEGADDPNSAVNKEAKKHKINLIRAKDLSALIILSSPKLVGLKELRDFFNNCHTVVETTAWIKQIRDREVNRGPIKELLQTAYDIIRNDKEPANLNALRYANTELKKHSVEDLRTLSQSLERLVPGFLNINNDVLSLQAPPDKILQAINQTFATNMPPEFLDVYLKAFSI